MVWHPYLRTPPCTGMFYSKYTVHGWYILHIFIDDIDHFISVLVCGRLGCKKLAFCGFCRNENATTFWGSCTEGALSDVGLLAVGLWARGDSWTWKSRCPNCWDQWRRFFSMPCWITGQYMYLYMYTYVYICVSYIYIYIHTYIIVSLIRSLW